MLLVSRHLGVGCGNHVHMIPIDMTDGIRTGPHRGITSGRGIRGTSNAILPSSALGGSSAASAFATVPWARRGSCRLVELLLMPQEQIPPSKASCAFRTFERFFLCMRAFVTFQVFQTGE